MENNNEFLKRVGMNIRLARIARTMKLSDLSELTGLHRSTLGDVENGKKDTHIMNLKAIADAFNMEVKDFL